MDIIEVFEECAGAAHRGEQNIVLKLRRDAKVGQDIHLFENGEGPLGQVVDEDYEGRLIVIFTPSEVANDIAGRLVGMALEDGRGEDTP